MSSSVYIGNKNKDIYSPKFAESRKRLVLSLHNKGSNSFLFVNTTKIYQFKAKNSEAKPYALRLGNISKDCTSDKIK